jgi:Rod binding domain-containing protein
MQIELTKPQLPTFSSAGEARLAQAKRAAERGDTRETAKQFETLFGALLVRELRRSMPQGMFGSGAGADVYEGWFDEHLGNALAERDSLGIARMIESTLARAQAARAAMEARAAEEGAA